MAMLPAYKFLPLASNSSLPLPDVLFSNRHEPEKLLVRRLFARPAPWLEQRAQASRAPTPRYAVAVEDLSVIGSQTHNWFLVEYFLEHWGARSFVPSEELV